MACCVVTGGHLAFPWKPLRAYDSPASVQHRINCGCPMGTVTTVIRGQVYTVSDSGIIGQVYGRKIHAWEVVAIDEAGDGLCWVRVTRFGDDWILIRSDAGYVSRAVRKLRQIPTGEQSERFPEIGP